MFENLSPQLRQQIAQILLVASYPQDTIIYHQGDPSESLYIVKKGKVDLLVFNPNLELLASLTANHVFGRMSFFTGSPHQTMAIVREDCQLEILPRSDFEELLEISPELLAKTEQILQQQEVKDYLHLRHGLSLEQISTWLNVALVTLQEKREIKSAVPIMQRKNDSLYSDLIVPQLYGFL